jgi:PAS domain S-box-containing protein
MRALYDEALAALRDAGPDAILLLDPDARITFASDRTTDVLGYRPDELVGASVTLLFPDDRQHEHRDLVQAYQEEVVSGSNSPVVPEHGHAEGQRREDEAGECPDPRQLGGLQIRSSSSSRRFVAAVRKHGCPPRTNRRAWSGSCGSPVVSLVKKINASSSGSVAALSYAAG